MASPRIKVLMASAEAVPFSKAGGLGDLAGALPKALWNAKVDARLITPLYGFIDRKHFHLRRVAGLSEIEIRVGENVFPARFYRANIPQTRVQAFFVECQTLFGRDGLYTDPRSGEGYWDNPTRYIFFCKAVVEFLKAEVFTPDIVHLHDNQTALVAPFLRQEDSCSRLSQMPVLLTINNLEYQGRYDMRYLYEAGLDSHLAYPGGPFEFYGDFCFLKAGIVFADQINTVSESYANESITYPEIGYGLEGVLLNRRRDYSGIINGIDTTVWDPAKDKLIPKTYTRNSLEGKKINKRALFEKCGFSGAAMDRPLIGIITRLAGQKGIDLILEAMDSLLALDIRFALLGTGPQGYRDALGNAERRHPERFKYFGMFDETLAHLIEAGSDMYLMPSRFEPCGLNQLYSLHYGTLPIVRRTGGLADTVRNYDPESGQGWGFVFDGYNSEEMLATVERALRAYEDKSLWNKLMRRAMSLDLSWDTTARRYRELYLKMIHVER